MSKASQWTINGRQASRRDLAEALALQRQHRAKLARADREARERDRAARAVGAEIRKAVRHTIGCKPKTIVGRNDGSRSLSRFERLLGSGMWTQHAGRCGGVSSFHFKLTPRGLGKRRQASGRPYKRGEIVQAIRYILRNAAREIEDGGIVSNVSRDPDTLATVFSALEELESMAGRANASVYVSLVVSLPAELAPDERLRLLQEICRFLDDHGLGYAGVLHAPDREGDQRNFHAHVLFAWRPLTLTDDGCAFATEARGALNTPAFVKEFRTHAAAAMNAAMAGAGHARRFTAEKTRLGPGSSKSEKLGPGRKHRDRRAQRMAAAEKERALLKERRQALQLAMAAAKALLVRPFVDRKAILADLQKRQQGLSVARETLMPSSVPAQDLRPATAVTVSHEKLASEDTLPIGIASALEHVGRAKDRAIAAPKATRSVDGKISGGASALSARSSAAEALVEPQLASTSNAATPRQVAAAMALGQSLDDARKPAAPNNHQTLVPLAGLATHEVEKPLGLTVPAVANRKPVSAVAAHVVHGQSTGPNLDPQSSPQPEQYRPINSSRISADHPTHDSAMAPAPVKPLDRGGIRSAPAPDDGDQGGSAVNSQARAPSAKRSRDFLRGQARARAITQEKRLDRIDDLVRGIAEVRFNFVVEKRDLGGGRSQEYFAIQPPSADDENAALIRAAIAAQETERMQGFLRNVFAKLHGDARERGREKREHLRKTDPQRGETNASGEVDAGSKQTSLQTQPRGNVGSTSAELDEADLRLLDLYNLARSSTRSR